MFWDKNGLYENLRELHHLTYRSVLLLSRGSCCMVDGRQRGGLGAPSRSLRQGLVCILVVIEGLNTKQHYNSFSEECHFIYYIFFMKCECLPCAPLLKWGHPLSCHHISILLRSPPDPVKSMMDSNWSNTVTFIWPKKSCQGQSKVLFWFFCNVWGLMFVQLVKIGSFWNWTILYSSSQAAFNLSNVYFLERIRRKKIFLSKFKKKKKKNRMCTYIWKSKCMIFKMLQV